MQLAPELANQLVKTTSDPDYPVGASILEVAIISKNDKALVILSDVYTYPDLWDQHADDRTRPTIILGKIWGEENSHNLVKALSQINTTRQLFASPSTFFSKGKAIKSLETDFLNRARLTQEISESSRQATLIANKF